MSKELKQQASSVLDLTPEEILELENLGGFDHKEAITYLKQKIAEKRQLSARLEAAETFINSHYKIRVDTVSNTIEARKISVNDGGEVKHLSDWQEFKLESLDIELQRNNINYPIGKLQNLIASDFVPEHDPIKHYFDNLPKWNGKDNIKALAKHVQVIGDKDRFTLQLKKHLARAYGCATIPGYYNKQCFVLVGERQNTGKTTFVRWLVPKDLQRFYQENPELNKDGLISISENLIINLDELDQLYRRDQKAIKSWLSKDYIKARRPYARKEERMNRRASFFGSSNEDDFLTDETGNVRYIVFRLNDRLHNEPINFAYSNLDVNQIWAQAKALFIDAKFEHNLTPQEVAENHRLNQAFKYYTPEEQLIIKYFKPAIETAYTHFLSTTELTEILISVSDRGLNLNTYKVGRALKSAGFDKTMKYDQHQKRSIPGYYLEQFKPFGENGALTIPPLKNDLEQNLFDDNDKEPF
jgi:predicted P-loop ATPase